MIEDDPRIDPAGLREIRFPGSFRRYDAKAVDDFLESVAERIVATNTLVDDLRRELESVRSDRPTKPAGPGSPFDAPDLTTLSEDELDQLVGEETAHVLSTARKAASDIRSKAEESAARVIREATAEAARLTEEAEAASAELSAEATSVRDTAMAAAEAAAEEVRSAAAGEAAQLVADGRGEADAIAAAADETRRAAEEEAARIVEEAKDEGRAMLAEAKSVRARVLADLKRRRDLGRSQVERLAAGRDQLLEAYAAVRSNLEEITGRLEVGLRESGSTAHDPLLDDGFAGIVISGLDDDAGEDQESGSEQDADEVDQPAEPVAVVDDPADEGDPVATGQVRLEDVEPHSDPLADTDSDTEAEPDVDALFAKIRAERAESVARAQRVLSGDEEPGDQTGDGVAVEDDTDEDVADETPAHGEGGAAAPGEDRSGTEHVPADLLADAPALSHRDDVLVPLDKKLARALKRLLADEQNEVLDTLRRSESTEPDDLLPPLESHVASYAEVAAMQLTGAAEAGASLVGGGGAAVDVTALAAELGTSLIEAFRRRIERSAADVDGDADALDERLRALYREWKVEHIGPATTDALLSAYALGQHAAAPEGATLRWLIDPGQGPCPDAQDNALAGAVAKGELFPTGDECPQAHPGCRCLLVVDT